MAVALESVQANGASGLNLREVARRLGVSLPSVQHHFATKDDLWRACVDKAMQEVPRPESSDLGSAGLVARLLERQFQRQRYMPGFTAAMSNDNEPGSEARMGYLAEQSRSVVGAWRAQLGAAMEDGLVRPVDPDAVLALMSLGVGSLASSREGLLRLFGIDLDDPARREAFVQAVADILLHGLLAP